MIKDDAQDALAVYVIICAPETWTVTVTVIETITAIENRYRRNSSKIETATDTLEGTEITTATK